MIERQLKSYIRTDSLNFTSRELLQASPIVLLGVSAVAEQQLQTLEIFSVFDLAMSRVFDAARRLTGTSDGPNDFPRFGSAAALNDVARELLAAADGNVVVSPAFTPAFTILGGTAAPQNPKEAREQAKRRAIEHAKLNIRFRQAQQRGALTGFHDIDEPFQMSASVRLANIGWSDPAGRLQKIVLVSDDGSETTVGAGLAAGGVNPDLGAPVSLALLRDIHLKYVQVDNEPHVLPITLTFRHSGDRTSALPFDCVLPKRRSQSTLLRIQPPIAVGSVVPHLQENALYYSQQILVER